MKRLHLILTLCSMWVILGSVFAQEERVKNLPDGAIVRLGKGAVGHGDRAVAFFARWENPRCGNGDWCLALRCKDDS